MPVNVLLVRDEMVDVLRLAVRDGGEGLRGVPELLRSVINEEAWTERLEQATGQTVRFTDFTEFVTAPPLEGLGATIDILRKICQVEGDLEALELLDRVAPGGKPTGILYVPANVQEAAVTLADYFYDEQEELLAALKREWSKDA